MYKEHPFVICNDRIECVVEQDPPGEICKSPGVRTQRFLVSASSFHYKETYICASLEVNKWGEAKCQEGVALIAPGDLNLRPVWTLYE